MRCEGALARLDERWYELYERDPLDAYYVRYVRSHVDEFFD